MKESLRDKISRLPHQPGVYRFLNDQGKIIYIGKAKELKKRVSSYFVGGRKHSYRIQRLVSQIADIAYTLTNSEVEALLLENNLIKTHQPRYNILLKDGKTFPYICIKNERFPRVFSTRQKVDDGSTYYGPYPSVTTLKTLLGLIRGLVKLRNCNYHLSEKNIQAGKFKRCLEFQIGNCAGPCEGLQSEAEYEADIQQVRHLLKGHLNPVIRELEAQMQAAAAEYHFEKAEFLKRKAEKLKAYKRKSTVVSEKIKDLEVLTVDAEAHLAVVNHFRVIDGAIVQTHAWEVKRKHQVEDSEIISATFAQELLSDPELASEMVVNVALDPELVPESLNVSIPQRGDKKHLIDLSLKNCRALLTEKLYNQNFKKRKRPETAMMEALQQELHLASLPDHIECFDNSNFQGSSPVASVVVFREGKPAKKDYRHFKIRTVEGPDDFASMKEIVYRRYKRLIEENSPLPHLIVIDGGKGQLSSAASSLRELGLLKKIPIIGIAKRLEEIYRVGDPFPLHIDKKSPALYLLQQLRNEAHRFAITFHRNLRSKAEGQRSKLTAIKGIGQAAEKKIIHEFRSIKKLKAASSAELEAKLGQHLAQLVQAAIADGKI